MAIAAFKAGAAVSVGDAVYVSSTSFLFKGSGATEAEASVIGVAEDSGTVGDLIRVNTDSIHMTLSGLTTGEYLYLSFVTPGLLVDFATWQSDLGSIGVDVYLTRVGRVLTSTSFEIEINKPILVLNPAP